MITLSKLASIDYSMDKMCAIAADAIINRLSDPAFSLQQKIPATFHLRASANLK